MTFLRFTFGVTEIKDSSNLAANAAISATAETCANSATSLNSANSATSANSANEQTRSGAFADVNVNAHLSTEQSQSKGRDVLLGKLIFSRRRVHERMTEKSDVKKGPKVQRTIAAGREDCGALSLVVW